MGKKFILIIIFLLFFSCTYYTQIPDISHIHKFKAKKVLIYTAQGEKYVLTDIEVDKNYLYGKDEAHKIQKLPIESIKEIKLMKKYTTIETVIAYTFFIIIGSLLFLSYAYSQVEL